MNQLTNKTIKAILKKTIPGKVSLPILHDVYIHDGLVEATDLDITVRVPYRNNEVHVSLNGKDFLENIEEDFKVRTRLEKSKVDGVADMAIVEAFFYGGAVVRSGDYENFPVTKAENVVNLGTIHAIALEKLIIASEYVSTDQLRPAMCAVFFGKTEICSTDAHRLYHIPNTSPLSTDVLIYPKTIDILSIKGLDQTWEVSVWVKKDEITQTHLEFVNGDGVRVTQRVIDDKFPNYPAVIPTDVPHSLTVDKKEFVELITKAEKVAPVKTPQIRMSLNGSLIISAEDVDSGKNIRVISQTAYYQGEKMEVGVNPKYLLSVLKTIKTPAVTIQLHSPRRAMIVGAHYIVMSCNLGS